MAHSNNYSSTISADQERNSSTPLRCPSCRTPKPLFKTRLLTREIHWKWAAALPPGATKYSLPRRQLLEAWLQRSPVQWTPHPILHRTLNQCFQDPTRSSQTTLLPNTKLYMANGWGASIYMAYADIHCRMELASFLFGLGELAS